MAGIPAVARHAHPLRTSRCTGNVLLSAVHGVCIVSLPFPRSAGYVVASLSYWTDHFQHQEYLGGTIVCISPTRVRLHPQATGKLISAHVFSANSQHKENSFLSHNG